MNEQDPYPKMYANEKGIWREDKPEKPFGLEWNEITRISGYKLEGFEEINTVLELDLEFGEFLELNSSWPGFKQVVSAISTRIDGINPIRFKELEESTEDDEPITIWEKA